LVGVADAAEEEPDSDEADSADVEIKAKKFRSINLDMRGSGVFKKKKGTVHVVLKVEGKEISEGMARLVDRLVQIQGDIG
jgi:2'-5' RNA ligase